MMAMRRRICSSALASQLVLRTTLWLTTSSVQRVAAMASTATPKVCDDHNGKGSKSQETTALQELWSTSFDGWIDVPLHPPGVVYLRPTDRITGSEETPLAGVAAPRVVKKCTGGLFALTGFNPMGQDAPMEENIVANERLYEELQQMDSPKPLYIWKAFGFAQDWREDGFIVAFGEGSEGGEKLIIDMAARYKQGAIYGFEPILDNEDVMGFRRRTIPVAMKNVEADVFVVPCEKPNLTNAEVTLS